MECQSRHHALLAKKWGGYSPPSPPGSGVPVLMLDLKTDYYIIYAQYVLNKI